MTKNSIKIFLIIILPIIVAVSYFGYSYFKKSASAASQAAAPQSFAMPVVGMEVKAGNLAEEINAVGSLEANQIATVRSEISGKVTKIDFAEGKSIKKGGLIAKIDDSNYRSDLERTLAEYDLAKENNKRALQLFKVGAISREEMDRAKSVIKQSKANYELAKSKMEKTRITAPFSGEISFRNINIGDLVNEGTEVTKIADISKIKVEFAVAERYLSKLKLGSTVYLKVDAYPDNEFVGSIIAVDPVTDPDTRTIRIKALISNRNQKLQPGMTAYVNVKLSEKNDALMIPEEAIISGDKKISVFRIIEGKAKETEVAIGYRDEGLVEIVEGLNAGDQIIVAGHMKIRDGMPVSVK